MNETLEKPHFRFELAVCLKGSGLLIGGCGIRREAPESRVGKIGWAINPSFQRQGYATEAAKALIQFGFNQLQLTVIAATCDAGNIASTKVMEKLDMMPVGLIRKERQQKGFWRDTLRYEVGRS